MATSVETVNFDFEYDKEHDDLFIYVPGRKSAGGIEIGNFVFDFDDGGKLVAIQVIDASEVFSKLISKVVELTRVRNFKADISTLDNMVLVKLEIGLYSGREVVSIPVPKVVEEIPVLK